ncbi:MAG TPA: amidohydrolase family protein, partial [Coriobacteriia bacterium]|nr:amidohydrolase family protein [Coriobacteriia bacterium]
PLKYLHMGAHLESLRRFIDAGVNVTMGTDLPPADMVGEMRLAMLMSRVADRDFLSGDPRDVFDAATVNAAYALNRSDLGRLAPGSKADVAVFDLRQMSVGAVHDPIRSLVEDGSGCFATHVMVDGKMVVEDGRFITIDEAEILATVQRDGEAMVRDIPNWVWGGRAPQEAIPPSYPPHSSP